MPVNNNCTITQKLTSPPNSDSYVELGDMLAEWKNPETGADSNSFSLYDPTAVSKKKKEKKKLELQQNI